MRSLQTVEKALWEKPSQIERGGMYVALGFSGAQAQEKQFLRSGNRPENREIFRFPQSFSPSMKIHRFSWSVSKSFFDRQTPRSHADWGRPLLKAMEKVFSALKRRGGQGETEDQHPVPHADMGRFARK